MGEVKFVDLEQKKRMTVLEIAQYLRETIPPGISPPSIYYHIRRAGIKIDSNSKLDLDEFLRAYTEHRKGELQTTGKPAGIEQGQDPSRYKKILECKRLEFELERLHGAYVSVNDHNNDMLALAEIFKRAIEHMPLSLAGELANPALLAPMQKYADNVLKQVSDSCKSKGL